MTPEKRRPLTRLQFARLALEQEGRCACCSQRLDFIGKRKIVDEHLHPIADHLEGAPDPNRMDNRALYCVDCAKEKTRKEAPARAKSKRYAEGRTQADKRKAAGGSRIKGRSSFPPKGTRKLQSRKFNQRSK